MGQEFIIKSQQIEDKINQLLPSQGGFAPGVDFSASTTVIPIVDLTETAEGSQLRQDLQTAIKFVTTDFNISNSTNSTIVNTTGYYRVFGLISITDISTSSTINLNITDGSTTKVILNGANGTSFSGVGVTGPVMYDFVVRLEAGHILRGSASSSGLRVAGTATQIADINGNLT